MTKYDTLDHRDHQDDSYFHCHAYDPKDAANRADIGSRRIEHTNISYAASERCEEAFNRDYEANREKSGDLESLSPDLDTAGTHDPGTLATSPLQHIDGTNASSMSLEERSELHKDPSREILPTARAMIKTGHNGMKSMQN